MIEIVSSDLSVMEEKDLQAWFNQGAAKLFLKVLDHRTKRLQVEAMNEAQKAGDGYRNLASEKLKDANDADAFKDLFEGYISGRLKPTTVKLS